MIDGRLRHTARKTSTALQSPATRSTPTVDPDERTAVDHPPATILTSRREAAELAPALQQSLAHVSVIDFNPHLSQFSPVRPGL
jgi:hypothetical protein